MNEATNADAAGAWEDITEKTPEILPTEKPAEQITTTPAKETGQITLTNDLSEKKRGLKNLLGKETINDKFHEKKEAGAVPPTNVVPTIQGDKKALPIPRLVATITDVLGLSICKMINDDFSQEAHTKYSKLVPKETKEDIISCVAEIIEDYKQKNEGKEPFSPWLALLGTVGAVYSTPILMAYGEKREREKKDEQILAEYNEVLRRAEIQEKIRAIKERLPDEVREQIPEQPQARVINIPRPQRAAAPLIHTAPEAARKRGQRGPDKNPRTKSPVTNGTTKKG